MRLLNTHNTYTVFKPVTGVTTYKSELKKINNNLIRNRPSVNVSTFTTTMT